MLHRFMIVTMLVGLWSVPSLYTPEMVSARPSMSQIRSLLRTGKKAMGLIDKITIIGGIIWNNRTVKRSLYESDGTLMFTYTAHCSDRRNVDRFWQHPENRDATSMIQEAFPNDSTTQRQVILNLVEGACSKA